MTIGIIVPNHVFDNSIALYDVPSPSLCRVFAVLGGSLSASLANHAGRARGEVVGEPVVESNGIRTFGESQYVRFSDLGSLSTSKVVQITVFKTSKDNLTAGVLNLWSMSNKSSDANQKRIYTGSVGSLGGPVLTTTPSLASASAEMRALEFDTWYIISQEVNGSAQGRIRVHDTDGTVLRENATATISGSIPYASDTAFEIGNGGAPSSLGGCLHAVCGLWSGAMSTQAIEEAAAYMAQISGLGS